jgi:predicted permease
VNNFIQDCRHSLRILARNPGFTVVAVLTLALGIGACTAIFTVVNAVLLRPLPYPDSQQIVQLWQVGERGGRGVFSDPNFEDLRDQNRSLEAVAQFTDGGSVSVLGGTEPVRAVATLVSKGFFEIIGVAPYRGRTFAADEQRIGAPPTAVVSYGFWQRVLDSDPNFSARKLTYDGRVYSVVGVMPPQFDFPTGVEVWTPRELEERNPHRTGHNWNLIARLKAGVTLQHARQDLSSIARTLKEQYKDDIWMKDVVVLPLLEQQTGDVSTALWVLMGAVATLLLIACANVANLLLAHVSSRQREIAVRAALGAGRKRLVKQFLTESLALALAGAALGAVLASWGVDAMVALGGERIPRAAEIRMDGAVLGFALGVSVLVAVILSVVPALRLSGGNLQELLREGGRANTAGAGQRRMRQSFVVAQIGLTLILLVGAGLLGKSFLQLLAVDTGYRTSSVVQMHISQPFPQDTAAQVRLAQFHQTLFERLRGIPGVTAVGGIDQFPLIGYMRDGMFLKLRGDEPKEIEQLFALVRRDPSRAGNALFRTASEGYFRAMNIPLKRGRLFDDRDGYDAPHVAVISESLAAKEWPGEDPIGRRVQYGNMDGDLREFTIVGIVGDVRDRSADREPQPSFYGHYAQRAKNTSNFNVVLHGSAPAATLIGAARSILRELAPDVPPRFRTIEEIFSASLADRQFNLALVAVFGGTALLLAMMGIYGVMAYTVEQRTQEIGIRMALGAVGGDVIRQFLREGGKLIVIGVVLGLAGAFALSKYISSLLYNTSVRDPLTFAAVAAALALVAVAACFVPARRATRVDPMVALRHE